MAGSKPVRASGNTPAREAAEEASKNLTEPPDASMPEDRARKFRGLGFSRMRFSWRGEDALIVMQAQEAVEERMLAVFPDALSIMHDIYELVRVPDLDQFGGRRFNQHGHTIWKHTVSGMPVEDFTKLTHHEKERFLFSITTRLYGWEQKAADIWGEGLLAKSLWEEVYANEYDAPRGSLTIEDRQAKANMHAAEDRYFAVFMSWLSRRADALVRSMSLIAQRLKDSMTS